MEIDITENKLEDFLDRMSLSRGLYHYALRRNRFLDLHLFLWNAEHHVFPPKTRFYYLFSYSFSYQLRYCPHCRGSTKLYGVFYIKPVKWQ
uniref:Uncharacterized protein n=1 Tax=Ciona savignyi TaxID=51511 RepID=H2YJG9_CIOSA